MYVIFRVHFSISSRY